MKVSILIPTYNGGNYIFKLLTKLIDQEENGYQKEIIIADSSSSDNTVEIVEKNFPMVKIFQIKKEDFNHGTTRNLLASYATGDYLLFMTQDALPYDNKLLVNLLSAFEGKTAIVYAKQLPYEDAFILEKFARSFNYSNITIKKDKESINKLGIKAFFNSNVCSMYRRDVFESLGRFPEGLILNEDLLYASKVIFNDYNIIYNAEATVYHSHNYSIKQQFKRYFDIGMAFSDTKHLLELVSNEKEGFKFVKEQIKFLMKSNKIHIIPYFFLETTAKYTAYLFGKKHYIFPIKIKRKFSAYMN